LVVVLQVVTEEWVRLNEGASSDNDLGPTVRHKVEGGEVLKDAHRVVGAEHGDCAREANLFGTGSCSSQQHRGRAGDVLFAMVLADPEAVQAHAVGEFDLLHQLRDTVTALLSGWSAIRQNFHKTINSDPHYFPLRFHPFQIY